MARWVKYTFIQMLIKKATTRVNLRLKKRPVSKDNMTAMVGTLADMMVMEGGVGVEIISELLKHGKKRRIAGRSFYTLEEKKELMAKVNEQFPEKVSSEK